MEKAYISGRHSERRIRMRVLNADELSLRSWENSDANKENKMVAKEVLGLRASLNVKLTGQTCQRQAVGNVDWRFRFSGWTGYV